MRFFHRFSQKNSLSVQKLLELEKKIANLEKLFEEKANQKTQKESPATPSTPALESPPTIKIEHLQIEKVIVEKLDYANNFGQLGIKDLSGKLNIGTSFEGDISKLVDKKMNDNAKVNFRAKKENNEPKSK